MTHPSRFAPVGGGWLWPALTTLFVGLVIAPISYTPLGDGLDSSWAAVLDYAHRERLQYGKDVIFTYGPLGFLITPFYSGYAVGVRLALDTVLGLITAAGVCLAGWRMAAVWRWVFIGGFTLLMPNIDSRHDLLAQIGMFCWGTLCFLESGRRLSLCVSQFALLALLGIWAKMNLLISSTLSVGVVGCGLALRGNRRLAAVLIAGFLGGAMLEWVALGQPVANLGLFLARWYAISEAYDQTMIFSNIPLVTGLGIATALLALASVIIRVFDLPSARGKPPGPRWLLFLAWFCALLLLIWKHAFVMAEPGHLSFLFGFAVVAALAIEMLPSSFPKPSTSSEAVQPPATPPLPRGRPFRRRNWARIASLACCVAAVIALESMFITGIEALVRPFRLAGRHLISVVNPGRYQREMNERLGLSQLPNALPNIKRLVGDTAVDVFGNRQVYATANQLNLRPRPVFQSYAAYSPPLMRMNERFYQSPTAPTNVLFQLEAYANRFPVLEDSLVLRHLLLNFAPVRAEGPFLLLRPHSHPAPPRLSLIKEGTVRPGEAIGLEEAGNEASWLEIELRLNWLGRLRQFFYHAPETNLRILRAGPVPAVASLFAPAPMLAAGFLANPLILDNEDVLKLHTGAPVARVAAYAVDPAPGTEALWRPEIRFRLYRLEGLTGPRANPEMTRAIQYPGFSDTPGELVAATNAILKVEDRPALFLPPGGYMRFAIPPPAKAVKGGYGFAPAAYVLGGATRGAEFQIEEELPDGTRQILHATFLDPKANPADRGLRRFFVPLSGEPGRALVFRAVPGPAGASAWDLTCWADIGFQY
jgi:hypothetical protein